MRRLVPATALLLLAAVSAQGQSTTTADAARSGAVRAAGEAPRPASDSLFRHARRLVAEGNGVAGRSLVDSLLRAADPATPAYGDALYWHGALAPTAAEAERDYRRVIVEYPLAYYADDALLAIAELEQARGDRAGALAHLQRFVKEHPSSPGRGIAALGAARLAFEQRDTTLGCSMIAAARSSAPASDVELRNQIEYHGRPCAGV
ncbi:MAG TPA: tetratricopeptide repeat protein, partial [Gemmatimonadaceae bacterium]|nr:tetratricopeptide repeat protein [Gemmatimonadaceae bacterium]